MIGDAAEPRRDQAERRRDHREWNRAVRAMTLEEVLATVATAWRQRRHHPGHWKLIANNVHLVCSEQAEEGWLRRQFEGLGT